MTRYSKMQDGRDVKDRSMYVQCRMCFVLMIGILGIKAREECVGCGGEALNVNNEEPSGPEELARRFPRKNQHYTRRL